MGRLFYGAGDIFRADFSWEKHFNVAPAIRCREIGGGGTSHPRSTHNYFVPSTTNCSFGARLDRAASSVCPSVCRAGHD